MVSFAQRMVNARARVMEKPLIACVPHQPTLRFVSGIYARIAYKMHSDMRFTPARVGAGGASVGALWCDQGTPCFDGVVLYIHGGAYTVGGAASHKHLAARIAGVSGLRGLLVDYRLAPEHPFPAATDDALVAYRALLAKGYSGDQIVLAGDSAGAGLCYALLAQILRDDLPKPRRIVAISPWVDMTMTAESYFSNRRAEMMLPVSWLKRARRLYLNGAAPDTPLASPLFADLAGAPKSLILVGAQEILRDDSRHMAAHLRDAGAEVELVEVEDVPHIWPTHLGRSPEADAAVDRIGAFLRRAFNESK